MNKYMLIDDDDFFLILNKDILTRGLFNSIQLFPRWNG